MGLSKFKSTVTGFDLETIWSEGDRRGISVFVCHFESVDGYNPQKHWYPSKKKYVKSVRRVSPKMKYLGDFLTKDVTARELEPAKSDCIYLRANCAWSANVFPAGEANFGQALYRSLERPPPPPPRTQASFAWPHVDLARPLRVDFRLFWIKSFMFVKVCGIHFCMWESFNHWFLYLMLSYFSDPSMFIHRRGSNFVEKGCVRKGAWRPRCQLVSPSLSIILYEGWIWANYDSKNSFKQLTVE